MTTGEQTSNPHIERPTFRPGPKERLVRALGIYDVMHTLHLVRCEEVRRLASFLAPHTRCLDVACGDGYFTRWFGERLDCSMRGVDLMESRIARAKFYNERAQCQFDLADAAELPYDDASFPQVVSVGSLEHFDEPEAVLAEMHRVLEPGGTIALTCDAMWNVGFSDEEIEAHAQRYYVHRYYTPDTLETALESAGFEVDRVEGIYTTELEIRLIRGAYRFGCDWSNPLYNVYSAVCDPVMRWARSRRPIARDRAIFLAARARKPE